jgi:hypothetical protein
MIRNVDTCLPRVLARVLVAAALTAGFPSLVAAQNKPAQKPEAGQAAQQKGKPAQKAQPAAAAQPGGPTLVATTGDWGVYVTSGPGKQCYALAQPKERAPKDLKRDAAYLFISTRPTEKVRNEVSVIMGFDVKAAEKTVPELAVGAKKFELAAEGSHLWVKDGAQLGAVVDTLRKGGKLTVKAASLRGNVTTDSYSLSGIGGALDRVRKECP